MHLLQYELPKKEIKSLGGILYPWPQFQQVPVNRVDSSAHQLFHPVFHVLFTGVKRSSVGMSFFFITRVAASLYFTESPT